MLVLTEGEKEGKWLEHMLNKKGFNKRNKEPKPKKKERTQMLFFLFIPKLQYYIIPYYLFITVFLPMKYNYK